MKNHICIFLCNFLFLEKLATKISLLNFIDYDKPLDLSSSLTLSIITKGYLTFDKSSL